MGVADLPMFGILLRGTDIPELLARINSGNNGRSQKLSLPFLPLRGHVSSWPYAIRRFFETALNLPTCQLLNRQKVLATLWKIYSQRGEPFSAKLMLKLTIVPWRNLLCVSTQ